MKSRSRYYPKWHSLPGVVAAYQPVRAPSHIQARHNVGMNMALIGRYNATLGVAPTWNAASGWVFNGSDQYLATGIVPATSGWSVLIRFSNVTDADYICGQKGAASTEYFTILPNFSNTVYYGYGAQLGVAPGLTTGILGIAGQQGYRNGVADGSAIGAWSGGSAIAVAIGARNAAGTIDRFCASTVQSFVIVNRILSRSEMWLASRQMAYCDVNPDWNVWARQRLYFYAPSVAAATFQAAWARNANSVIKQVNP